MAFIYPNPVPVFPTLRPGYSMHMKPTFATAVQTSAQGFENRSAKQAFPLWEFELTFEILADQTQNAVPDPYYNGYTELGQLCGLFLVVNGQYGRFYYTCPEDCSRTGQAIGVGDGTTATFTMIRTWGSAGFVEPVGAVNQLQPFTIYLDGTPLGGFFYGFDMNTITFTTPPGNGVVITADFFFYYFCRFIEDLQDFDQFYHHLWQVKTLKFRSVKP